MDLDDIGHEYDKSTEVNTCIPFHVNYGGGTSLSLGRLYRMVAVGLVENILQTD